MTEAERLLDASLTETVSQLRAGAVSSLQLTQAALARAEAMQPSFNAFIRIDTDAALARAADLDRDAAAGRWQGPLHGIPLAHKDCFERPGQVMSLGSRVPSIHTGTRLAGALQRLEQAGAVDLGALNMSEMVAGPTGQNPHFGDCCNAWDMDRISGGSSSGSGTAVALGLVHGSLGSDTGGSIRLPATMNGLFGLKPTYGRVSRYGCFPRAFSLDCVGPLARTAKDCALLLSAIAGYDTRDASSLDVATPDYANQLENAGVGSRIGVLDTGTELDPSVAAALENLVTVASQRYGEVRRQRYDKLQACYAMGDTISKVEAATRHGVWMRDTPSAYSQAVYSRTELGLHIPAVRYLEALCVRGSLLEEFVGGLLTQADILLLPTIPITVPTRVQADMETGDRVFGVVSALTTLTRPFSYLGLPVLSMPVGLDANGMPIGVQLVGRPFSEARLLSVAHVLTSELDWQSLTQRCERTIFVSSPNSGV